MNKGQQVVPYITTMAQVKILNKQGHYAQYNNRSTQYLSFGFLQVSNFYADAPLKYLSDILVSAYPEIADFGQFLRQAANLYTQNIQCIHSVESILLS